jgi:hypothetical protein
MNLRPVFSRSSFRRGEDEAKTTGFVIPVIYRIKEKTVNIVFARSAAFPLILIP